MENVLYEVLQRIVPLAGGGAAVVMGLRIVYRYVELRFQEREALRAAAAKEDALINERFSIQFETLVSGAVRQTQSLEELIAFMRNQWEHDSHLKTEIILRLENELRRLRYIMDGCQRCVHMLADYEEQGLIHPTSKQDIRHATTDNFPPLGNPAPLKVTPGDAPATPPVAKPETPRRK